MNDETPDRYVTFLGLDCDAKADRLYQMLQARMAGNDSPWVGYFEKKLAENTRMGHDMLRFVGAQVNALMSFFEEEDDEEALVLLHHLEYHCC
ncbi:hypothetical protein C8J27_102218 [Rhodobacter aestuarii]|uniref:N(2)-fixation sustaining protein CowN n=1 Tax=Rhodobacter aestuarii TaxID=453582 RepID=A0A1N7NEU5_9RHOB|nr:MULTISPECIES: N(2)-fixation sustaining protein CowN [Rhodobacter]PTV96424.1 hypothetical protein C8J27_102218 [Rhodobacter aestuarii]SIS96923.1 hypothetical protein SAMN05421580_107218 [Rhodobacter aestuarii]SOB92232.1 hypothetical protein SAMN05877809_101515 [Rhodobacter sp. JA431]